MKQMTMASSGFQKFSKTTRRAQFLAEMDQVVPWAELCALIEPFYPVAGKGRPPKPLQMMLRIHLLQQWFNLSDPGVEEALYDSEVMRQFAGIDLGQEPVPDETTILNFRHLLERNNLGMRIFQAVGAHLQARGLKLSSGTIVDATIVSAPSSTKNQRKQRDPEMHQTRKGKQWYFGMKVHVGVDRRTKLIHSTVVTAANAADSSVLPDLLHGDETAVWGDQAYRGQSEAIAKVAPRAKDLTNRRYRHRGVVDEIERARNRVKSKVRSRVEHAIGVIKRVFGFAKVRYRGLRKNANQVFVLAALANLFMVRRRLMRT
jgi:IS5 family transposase